MKGRRVIFILAMLLNTSCTVILPSTGRMADYPQREEIRCRPFALPKEPSAPYIPRDKYDDDAYVIKALSAVVTSQKTWIDETKRRIYFACGEL